MKMLVFVLNKVDVLDRFLTELSDAGIRGATIITSTGMARALYNSDEGSFFSSLKFFLDPEKDENYTIFAVLQKSQVETFKRVVKEVVGDLSEPSTGVLFTLPVEEVEGITLPNE